MKYDYKQIGTFFYVYDVIDVDPKDTKKIKNSHMCRCRAYWQAKEITEALNAQE